MQQLRDNRSIGWAMWRMLCPLARVIRSGEPPHCPLQQKQDDLEICMRGNNLRFIGLPEGTEGNNPATFLEELLITSYGHEAFSQSFIVDRVCRMPAKKPSQGVPP